MVRLQQHFSSRIVANCHIVTEILFSVILEGYIQTLEAVSARSKARGLSGDVCAVVLASFSCSINHRFQDTAQQHLGHLSGRILRCIFLCLLFFNVLSKCPETRAFTG